MREAEGSGKRRRGRPRKTPLPESASHHETTPAASETKVEPASSRPRRNRSRTSKEAQPSLPPRLTSAASTRHSSLSTFLQYARAKDLNPASNVYRGTHYEYTCISTLSSKLYNFQLARTGRANDLGIDLLGWWKLPAYVPAQSDSSTLEDSEASTGTDGATGKTKRRRKSTTFRALKVLAQCKISSPTPAMIRELEGAYVGAPAGWSSSSSQGPSSTLALLISSGAATKGVIAALQRSRWPMGLLQITREGEVKQFLWNAVAAESGLQGLGVVVRYSQGGKGRDEGQGVGQSVRLSWMGRVWRA